MEIPHIKSLLSITELLHYMGIPTPKNTAAKSYSIQCPFHQEKNKRKKQLSVYPSTNSLYCFSTKCPTHPHSQDVISVVKHFYKLDDHQAIMKCKQIIHEQGKWPTDIYNPFAPSPSHGEGRGEVPMKTAEKKAEQTTDDRPPTSDQHTAALTKNQYGQLCYITQHLQIHLLNEPEIKSLNSLRVGLLVQKNPHINAGEAIRQGTIDLYHYEAVQKFIKKIAEQLTLSHSYTHQSFSECIELLEKYKMDKQQQNKKQPLDMPTPLPILTLAQQQQMDEILHSYNIIEKINELIGKAGIVGEESNRMFLFTILSAYKLQQPLSALIQGSSGSGKTALFAGVLQFFPQKDVFNSTRITDGSLYNFGEHELMFKIIANEDIDGLSPAALFALRELVSKGFITSSTTIKDEEGNIKSTLIKVNGPVSFAGCTTQASLYEDNMGRVFTIAVDESIEQTKRIIDYQNKKSAGKIDRQQQAEAILLLQHIVQKLQPVEVINAYAEYINLPDQTHQLRRLNALFKIYIEQITRLHQQSEKPDNKGFYKTTKQHIQLAADSFFECIVLKCDELNGEIRKFYEWLKAYISKKSKESGEDKKQYRFTQREIRQAYNKSKASISNYFQHLSELEYISSSGGNNRKIMYQVEYWDDYQAMRKRLKDFIQKQIDALPDAQ